jgi:hypothetical protein
MVVSFYTITSFINFLTSEFLAFFVIAKNRKNPKNIAFFILANMIGLWSLSYFFWQNVTDSATTALFWCRTLMVFTIIIPAAYFHFTLAITETIEKRKKTLIFVYLVFYFFLLTDVTPFFIKEVSPVMNFKYWPMATPLFSAYLICFAVCTIYSSFLLIKKYKSSAGIQKSQIKYVAIGIIIAFISGSSNFIPWYKIPIPPIGNALVPIYIFFIAYAITRYKLMNIKVLFRNTLFYFGIAVFVYIAFFGVAFSYQTFFGSALGAEALFAGLFVSPLFAILLYSSINLFSTYINKYFFPSIYTYQQGIKDASYKLSHHTNLNDIAQTLSDIIKNTIQPNGVAILFVNDLDSENKYFEIAENYGLDSKDLSAVDYNLFDKYFQENSEILTRENIEQLIQDTKSKDTKILLHEIENQLHEHNIFICAPLKNSSSLLGLVVANNKQYEVAYLKEDFDLLETLSHYAQIAVENAFLYKKIEKENFYLKKTSETNE